MSLEKSIYHSKEHRKPYYKSERFDRTCRPNGSCSYCQENRFHKIFVQALNAEDTRYDCNKRNVLREIKSELVGLLV